jgi:hypothetical protein
MAIAPAPNDKAAANASPVANPPHAILGKSGNALLICWSKTSVVTLS